MTLAELQKLADKATEEFSIAARTAVPELVRRLLRLRELIPPSKAWSDELMEMIHAELP